MADTDPWQDAAQSYADDQWMQQQKAVKAAVAAAPVGASNAGNMDILKNAPGAPTQATELPPAGSSGPAPTVISGGPAGVSSGSSAPADPWEATAAQMQLHNAMASGKGQDLSGLLRQADRTGAIPPPPQQQAPPPLNGPQYDPSTPWGRIQQAQFEHEGVMASVLHDQLVNQRWADEYGSALVDQKNPAFQNWAKSNGKDPDDPHAAADYLKQTLPPQMVQQAQKRFEMETTWVEALHARDQVVNSLISEVQARYPGLSDDGAISKFVHQQLQQLGVPDGGIFPPVKIQQGQAVPDVGNARGVLDAFLKGAGTMVYKPAEFLEGLGQAAADRMGGPGASGPGTLRTMRMATENADAGLQQALPSSTTAQTNPGLAGKIQRSAENVSEALPVIGAAAATGGASAAGGAGLFGLEGGTAGARLLGEALNATTIGMQQGGATYDEVYQSAKQRGMSDKQASAAAAIGGTIDGAVNAYLMRFGAVGSMERAGARAYLGSIVKTAMAQGGVSAAQDLVTQFANFAATGKDPEIQRLIQAGIAGTVTGGFYAAASPAGMKAAWQEFSGAKTAEAQQAAADKASRNYGRGTGGLTDADARQWLGLDPKAPLTMQDVTDAWRTKLQEVHPDRGGTAADFERTTAARSTLRQNLGQPGTGKPTTPKGPPPTEQETPVSGKPDTEQAAAGKPAADEPAAAGPQLSPGDELRQMKNNPAPPPSKEDLGDIRDLNKQNPPPKTPEQILNEAEDYAKQQGFVERRAINTRENPGRRSTDQAAPEPAATVAENIRPENRTDGQAAAPTDSEILADQQQLVDLRGKLQRGELAGDEKAAAEKTVDHLAATIQEKHARYGEAHGEDAGEDLFEKMAAVAETPASRQTEAHGQQNDESPLPVQSGNEQQGRDATRNEGDAQERQQGRGADEPLQGQSRRQGQERQQQRDVGKRALWPELDEEVARLEAHEDAARTLQKATKGVSDDDAHDMVRQAVNAARLAAKTGDPDAPAESVNHLLDDKRFNGDAVPPELTRKVLDLAGLGEQPKQPGTTAAESDVKLTKEGPWDYKTTFPPFTDDAIEHGLAQQAVAADFDGTHEEGVKSIHDSVIEELVAKSKYRQRYQAALDAGKDLSSGKPLTLKQRKAAADLVKSLSQERDDLIGEYSRHFGEEAADSLAKHVGAGDNTAVKTARRITPIEDGLLSALSNMQGWEGRWSAIRASGADDQQVREFIAKEFGIAGGQTTEYGSVDHKGGENPKVTVSDKKGYGEAVEEGDKNGQHVDPQDFIHELKGKRLISEVRRLLGIGQPGETPPELPYVHDEVLPGSSGQAAAGGAVGGRGEGELAQEQPAGVQPTEGARPTGQRGARGGSKRKGALRNAGEPGGGPAGSGGAGQVDVHPPGPGPAADAGGKSGGAEDTTRSISPGDVEREKEHASPALSGNYRMTEPAMLEAGGARTKFKNNVAAIELLRKIQGEGRERATPAEQDVLAKFSGWGQFPQVFNDYGEHDGEDAKKWADERAILKDLLGDGWEAAKRSTLNAHYTSPFMVESIYKALDRMGFAGGRVLEPSMGAGVFFGLLPESMRDSRLTGVELDPTTGAIARLLYPDANIQVKGFQDVAIPHGFFDAAVGNVPFGDYKVHDPAYNKLRAPIHDYFIVKTLDLTRPGGIVALITSTGSLDKASGELRAEMAARADLVAAARLPEGAFVKSAGTQVVTDVLVFQRREEGQTPAGKPFAEITTLPDPDGGEAIPINEYFQKHPEHVLGTLDRKSRLYRGGDMHVSRTDDFEQRLEKWLGGLPKGLYKQAPESPAFKRPRRLADDSAKAGGYVYEKGRIYRKKAGELTDAGVDEKAQKIIADTLQVRDALRDVVNGQLAQRPESELGQLRAALLKQYKAFVKAHGPLHKKANALAFSTDPDAPVVLALEKSYDPKTQKAEMADVFTKNTVRGYTKPEKADDTGSALGISLNETGGVDLPRIAGLLGKSQDAVAKELVSAGLAYKDPAGGWKSAETYLSGNVRKKLLEAMDAAAADPQFKPNVRDLEKVIPPDVDYDQIGVRLGSSWVPPSDVQAFAAHVMGGVPEHFNIRYLPQNATWMADYTPTGQRRHKDSPNDRQLWGTERAPFMEILEAALNTKQIRITDPGPEKDSRVVNKEATEAANGKVRDLMDAFAGWVWDDDDRRARLHRYYNDTFNNLAPVKWNGAHLTLPGSNPMIELRPHQKNFVWRSVSTGTGLAGHEVGTGKTYSMVAAAMEMRRLGLSRKPAIAAPKKTFSGLVDKAKELYPNARIHVVEDFEAKGRKAAVSKISTGDYDLVLMTHDHLNMLPMDSQVQADFIRRELQELEDVKRSIEPEDAYGSRKGKSDSRMVKQLEKMKASLEARLEEALEGKKDNAITFEQTGIDQLLVDEAHAYKSLPVYTKHTRVKGIPANRSQRATAMWMRGQWLQEMNGGRGLIFATGTPVTNTMTELYTMQRYLQMKELEARGVASFDAWASTFGTMNTRMEYSVAGEYQPVTRFNAFINLPELQQIARQAIDVQRAKDLPGFNRPKRRDSVVAVPPTPEQTAYLQTIKQRAIEAKKKRPGEAGDNMLSISTDARKSAVDHRLIDPSADMAGGKVDKIAENLVRILRENPGTTQMVFSDFGLHPNERNSFTFFGALEARLGELGIPKEKIVNFTTLQEAKQKDAEARMQSGDAIVGLASSTAGGTGINVQNHLIALHHADVPWTPAFIEQRDGRGWRQGNRNPEVRIIRYVTEGGFDTFMWQTVDAKARFISQFMNGDSVARAVAEEDGEELTHAQVMAIASGDPMVLDKINLEAEVTQLEKAEQRHQRSDLKLRDTAADLARKVAGIPAKQASLKKAIAAASARADDEFEFKVGNDSFSERADAGEALQAAVEKLPRSPSSNPTWKPVGEFHGFPIEGTNDTHFGDRGQQIRMNVGGTWVHPTLGVGSIEHYARPAYWEGRLGEVNNNHKAWAADMARVQSQIGKPFPHTGVLKQKKADLADIIGKMSKKAEASQPAPQPASEIPRQAYDQAVIDQNGQAGPYGGGGGTSAASISQQPFATPAKLDGSATGKAASPGRALLRPIAMPELIKLAKELMQGGVPLMKKLPKSMGLFSVKGGRPLVRIDPRKAKGPEQIAAVLAHELGHLEDWTPTATLARGNLVGRIQKLNRFMAQSWGTMTSTNQQLREELIKLSEWWSPYDAAKAPPSYAAYRNTPRELYAQALSVLLNAPGEVESRAPNFYREFLEALDRRPEFRNAYLDLQDHLAGTPEAIAASRRLDVREAYAKGEDILKARTAERMAAASGRPLVAIRQLLLDSMTPAILLQRQAEKKLGHALDDSQNAERAWAELAYADNENHLWLKKVDAQVHTPMLREGLSPEDMGEYLQMVRTESERAEMANPQGHTPETARAMLKDLQERLGKDKFDKLVDLAKTFHDLVHEVVAAAKDVGYYNAKQYKDVLEPNKYRYATFAVLDHLQDSIGAGIIQQVGTFKDVANPYTATMLKTMSLWRAVQRQKAVVPLVQMLKSHFADDIEKGKPRIGLGGRRSDPGKPPVGRDWLAVFEDGHPEWYAVDPYIARMYQSHDIGMLNQVGKVLQRITYGTLHPLYVVFNLGWHLRLLPKDFIRTYRNTAYKGNPTTVREILAAYAKAMPTAYKRATGQSDPLLEEMLADKALDLPWKDFDFNETHDSYERLLDRYGLGEQKDRPTLAKKVARTILPGKLAELPFALLHGIEAAGGMLVSTPKIAGWHMLTARGIDGAERAFRVRNHMGHPDRRRRGLGTNLSNGVAMYSNILIQFLRADYNAGAQDPTTRSGWWARTILTSVLPKALMLAAAAGLFGAWLKKHFDLISEDDKTKNIIIPLWNVQDDPKGHGRKAVYVAVPQDAAGTLIGGMLWKLLHKSGEPWLRKIMGMIDVPYADGPHINPYLQSVWNWGDYIHGQNPWDSFRQRSVISDEDFKAGGWYAAKDMLAWQLNQLGVLSTLGHAAITHALGKPEGLNEKETAVEATLASIPGINSFLKVSDRGVREQQEIELAMHDMEQARLHLALGDDVLAAVRERYRLELVKSQDTDPEDAERRARLNAWYGRVYLPITKAIKEAVDRGDQQTAARLRARLSETTSGLH